MDKKMGLIQWVISTIIAAATMAAGFSTYVHQFVYTRNEAADFKEVVQSDKRELTERIGRLETRVDSNQTKTDSDFNHIRDQLDRIYQIGRASCRERV